MLKERIEQKFGTEILDGNRFTNRQLEVVWEILSNIPNNLFCLHKIFEKDVQSYKQTPFWVCIPATNIGQPENQFPEDFTKKCSDLFSMIFVHELNHQVFKHYIEPNERLIERHRNLIITAGTDRLQYLRGHIPEMEKFHGKFFLENPQEFFASISNQYFSSSFITFEFALSRFKKGKREPINQFLFFADIYSIGENRTRYYTLDVNGNLQRYLISLSRNQFGHIESIAVDEMMYRLIVDRDGSVLKIRT